MTKYETALEYFLTGNCVDEYNKLVEESKTNDSVAKILSDAWELKCCVLEPLDEVGKKMHAEMMAFVEKKFS